jgi:hypothetical protein
LRDLHADGALYEGGPPVVSDAKELNMKIQIGTLVLAAALAVPAAANAERPHSMVPPPVPELLDLSPDEFTPFFVAHAIGTQGYVCVAVGATYSWKPFGPQATLFDEKGGQVSTHFLSPRPVDAALNATWQHSRDTSAVWAEMLETSSDPDFVSPDAIPWLLLKVTAIADGPTGGDKLTAARRIQRVNTVEGKAPAAGCAEPVDIGKRALVPYEADYYFYKQKPGR